MASTARIPYNYWQCICVFFFRPRLSFALYYSLRSKPFLYTCLTVRPIENTRCVWLLMLLLLLHDTLQYAFIQNTYYALNVSRALIKDRCCESHKRYKCNITNETGLETYFVNVIIKLTSRSWNSKKMYLKTKTVENILKFYFSLVRLSFFLILTLFLSKQNRSVFLLVLYILSLSLRSSPSLFGSVWSGLCCVSLTLSHSPNLPLFIIPNHTYHGAAFVQTHKRILKCDPFNGSTYANRTHAV